MDHVAILTKKWKLLEKVVSGEKTIESRWYKHKKKPYGAIKKGDTVYFKNSGEPVTVKAEVSKALFFDLRHTPVKEVLEKYGKQICIRVKDLSAYKGLNYCTLVFLKDVQKIEPFEINKEGFGLMAAWITVEDIKQIRNF